MEHCRVRATQRIRIGQGCLVSGLRSYDDDILDIPDHLMVHVVPLSSSSYSDSYTTMKEEDDDDDEDDRHVLLVLGMEDAIKGECDTLYGRPLELVRDRLGLTDEDIWGPSTGETTDADATVAANREQHSIWTAKLHPVISLHDGSNDSFSSVFGWLPDLLSRTLLLRVLHQTLLLLA